MIIDQPLRRSFLILVMGLLPGLASGVPVAPGDAPAPPWLDAVGRPLSWRDGAQATTFLRQAEVLEVGPELDGTTRPHLLLLGAGDLRVHAIFRTVDRAQRRLVLENGAALDHFRDRYASEVAAYALDRLLDLRAVPPTVLREIDGTSGSVQLWIESSFSILDRRESGREPPDWDAYNHQVRQMSVFDNLINNVDRNQTNAVIDGDWKVWYIDHTRAFLRGRRLYDPDRVVQVGRRLWQRLQEVPDARLRDTLTPYLGRHEIDDLLVRRGRLVDLIRSRIESLGEAAVLFDEPAFLRRLSSTASGG